MTKEQLLELGLNEDQIKEVFRLNGLAVERAKGETGELENKLKTKEKEVETLTEQLDTANSQIDDFKKLDVDEIKKAAEDYKELYETEKEQKEQEIKDLQFDYKVDKTITSDEFKGKNTKAIKALLDLETIKGAEDIDKALNKALKELSEENDYLFGKPEIKGTGGSLGGGPKDRKDPEKSNYGRTLANQLQSNKKIDTSPYEL